MTSPLFALSWEFWWRHRLGLLLASVGLVGFAVVGLARPFPAALALASSMAFLIGLSYVIGVFAYGFDGKLEGVESGFPARLFLLPVRTGLLVGWPMVQGIAVAVGAWLVWERCVLWPAGVETAAWWTPMLAAVVATSQAIVWLSFGLPWVRILVATTVLIVQIRSAAILTLFGGPLADPRTQEVVLSLVALAIVPLAYLTALAGVARARRGDAADWLSARRSARRAGFADRDLPPFRSALRAQVWLEWRLRGRGYVIVVLSFVAFLIACALLLERGPDRRPGYAATILLIPILVAGLGGLVMGFPGDTFKPGPLTAFLATRPLSNVEFVTAKVRAAGRAAVVCWVLVAAVALAWLTLTGGLQDVASAWNRLEARFGPATAGGLVIALAVGPVAIIWRMFAVNLWAGLTGRGWIVAILGIATAILILQFASEWVRWNADPVRREQILDVLPWAGAVAVGLKLTVAVWALRTLHRRGDLSGAVVLKLLAAWCLAAVGLVGVLTSLLPAGLVPLYGLALGVALILPLARPALGPLALAWNRHR
jgi:hypothetical protein